MFFLGKLLSGTGKDVLQLARIGCDRDRFWGRSSLCFCCIMNIERTVSVGCLGVLGECLLDHSKFGTSWSFALRFAFIQLDLLRLREHSALVGNEGWWMRLVSVQLCMAACFVGFQHQSFLRGRQTVLFHLRVVLVQAVVRSVTALDEWVCWFFILRWWV